jgi:Restriction endonuclease
MPTNFEEIFEWYKEFDTFRIQEKNNEETDPEILTFQDKITHASDGTASIEWRHNFFLKNFLMKFPKLETKDSMRNFTDEQKRAIFYRDKQICQLKIKCNGKKLSWGNWHADHINPYSKGGKTIVENGRVSCAECNLSRGAG